MFRRRRRHFISPGRILSILRSHRESGSSVSLSASLLSKSCARSQNYVCNQRFICAEAGYLFRLRQEKTARQGREEKRENNCSTG